MRPLVMNILGVMHYVTDLKFSSEWYCEKLGFTVGHYDFNDFVELTVDGQYVMHLFKTKDLKPMEKAAFVFGTKDIGNAHKQLIGKHVDVEPITYYEDHAGFSFKDCEGNILMI